MLLCYNVTIESILYYYIISGVLDYYDQFKYFAHLSVVTTVSLHSIYRLQYSKFLLASCYIYRSTFFITITNPYTITPKTLWLYLNQITNYHRSASVRISVRQCEYDDVSQPHHHMTMMT